MKKQIHTEIILHAPVNLVWSVLSDFSKYPGWSKMIKSFANGPKVGERTKIKLEQPGGSAITMNPVFLKLDENKEIRWLGSLFIPGLFDGEHYIILHEIDKETTLVQHGEIFTGILVMYLKKMIDGNTTEGFNLFNVALKERVEGL